MSQIIPTGRIKKHSYFVQDTDKSHLLIPQPPVGQCSMPILQNYNKTKKDIAD